MVVELLLAAGANPDIQKEVRKSAFRRILVCKCNHTAKMATNWVWYPSEFHTYGMNSASMTFILAAVCSSYRGCEKTFVIPKLRVKFTPHWQTALLGQRSSKSVEGKSIYAFKKFLYFVRACSAAFFFFFFFFFITERSQMLGKMHRYSIPIA